jgi:hypothetical protein
METFEKHLINWLHTIEEEIDPDIETFRDLEEGNELLKIVESLCG